MSTLSEIFGVRPRSVKAALEDVATLLATLREPLLGCRYPSTLRDMLRV
jgi:hypothetical protein